MEMTAPTAAAAMATVIIEPERRSSMMVSLCKTFALSLFRPENRISAFPENCPRGLLLQRIGLGKSRGVLCGHRSRPAPFGELAVFLPRRLHHRGKPDVAFEAARLVINPVLLL